MELMSVFLAIVFVALACAQNVDMNATTTTTANTTAAAGSVTAADTTSSSSATTTEMLPPTGGGGSFCNSDDHQKAANCDTDATTCVQALCPRYNVLTDANPIYACPLEDECSADEIAFLRSIKFDAKRSVEELAAIENGTLSRDCVTLSHAHDTICLCAKDWAACRTAVGCSDDLLADRECGFSSCLGARVEFEHVMMCDASRVHAAIMVLLAAFFVTLQQLQ